MTATPIAAPHHVTPLDRTPLLIARGRRVDLVASLSLFNEGELCWAEDEGILYIVTAEAGIKELRQASAGVFIGIQPPVYKGLSAPNSPEVGTLWFDSNGGILKVWNGRQWLTIGDMAPTVVSPTRPTSPAPHQFWVDTSNAAQPRLFVYDGHQFIEIKPPLASAHNHGLLAQADWVKLQGLQNAATPDWNAGPGVPGEILNKPVIPAPVPLATTTRPGIVQLATAQDLQDPNCADRAVVANQVQWLAAALAWWRSTWLPSRIDFLDNHPGIWMGRDDALETHGPIEISLDDGPWGTGPSAVHLNTKVEGRWDLDAVLVASHGDRLAGWIRGPLENLQKDYELTLDRQIDVPTFPSVVDVPLGGWAESEAAPLLGGNAPYWIWAQTNSERAEVAVNGGEWIVLPSTPGGLVVFPGAQVRLRQRMGVHSGMSVATVLFAGDGVVNDGGTFQATAVREALPVLADLDGVLLEEVTPGGPRFTDQSFRATLNFEERGVPEPVAWLRGWVEATIDRTLRTDAITAITRSTAGLGREFRCAIQWNDGSRPVGNPNQNWPYIDCDDDDGELGTRWADYDPSRCQRWSSWTFRGFSCTTNWQYPSSRLVVLLDAEDEQVITLDATGSPWRAGDEHHEYDVKFWRWDSAQRKWIKDGTRRGRDLQNYLPYTFSQPARYVAISGKGGFPLASICTLRPRRTVLTFASAEDLAYFRVGDPVQQDDASLQQTAHVIGWSGDRLKDCDRIGALPSSSPYPSTGRLPRELEDLRGLASKRSIRVDFRGAQIGGTLDIGLVCYGEERRYSYAVMTQYKAIVRDRTGKQVASQIIDLRRFHEDSEDAAAVQSAQVQTPVRDGSLELVRLYARQVCPDDRWDRDDEDDEVTLKLLWLGGRSLQPTAVVQAIDMAARTMTIEQVWGTFAVGRRIVGDARRIDGVRRWLLLGEDGEVLGLRSAPSDFRKLAFSNDSTTLHFPALLDSGHPPDVDLPAGAQIQVEVRVENRIGADIAASNWVQPGGPTAVTEVMLQQFRSAQAGYAAGVTQQRQAAVAKLQGLQLSGLDLEVLRLIPHDH